LSAVAAIDSHARLAQPDEAPVQGHVRLEAVVSSRPLGNFNALALALSPRLVVVARGLERDPQHLLHRFQHDARNAGAVGD
jgi:hypothetical protein